MKAYRTHRVEESFGLALLLLSLFGCGPQGDSQRLQMNTGDWSATISGSPSSSDPGSTTPALAAPEPVIPVSQEDRDAVATLVDARPAAMVNGRTVLFGDLRAALTEAAGADVLREVILDRKLALLLSEAGLSVSADDVAAERAMLLATLSDDGGKALRLLDELRAQQGLGEQRFAALTRRNAALRALVQPKVHLTEQAILQMFDVSHGPKRQVRLITIPSLADAQAALERIKAGELFAEVAVMLSSDSSAARGGLLEPISQSDPSYPAALRDAIWLLNAPGEVSSPTLLENGFAFVQLVRIIDADGVSFESVFQKLQDTVRMSQERLLMDQLARKVLNEAQITIFDESLRESWQFAQQRER